MPIPHPTRRDVLAGTVSVGLVAAVPAPAPDPEAEARKALEERFWKAWDKLSLPQREQACSKMMAL